ncbi:MAG: O-antigen ligase family protein [Spirochaetota bacterium]
MAIAARVRTYCLEAQERLLFQFGFIVLCAGLPISTSVIEIGKGIIIVSFLIALIRRRASVPLRDIRIITASLFFLFIIISSVIASFGPHAAHSWGRFPGMLAFFLLFISFAAMFDIRRDAPLILVLFAAMAVNGGVIIRDFIITHERSGGLFHPVMSNVHFWPAVTLINLGIAAFVRRTGARIFWSALLAMNIVVIGCLFSTTSFIVFPILFVALVIAIAPRRIALFTVFAVLLAAIVLMFMFQNRLLDTPLQQKIEQVMSNRHIGVSQRAHFWRGAGELISERPFFGIGNGLWKYYFYEGTAAGRDYVAKGMDGYYFHAHNNAIEIAVAYGMPALLAVIAFFAAVFIKGSSFLRTLFSRGRREFAVCAAIYAGIIAVLLQGMSDYTLFAVTGGSFVWALLGAFIAMEQRR